MRRPSVGHVPLETGLDEARGERSVVPVQKQVDRGEGAESLALVIQDIRWDYPDPEGVEGGGGIEVVPGIGSQVVVIESELVGIPEQIEDSGTELGSSVAVACGLRGSTGLVEVIGKNLMRLVWKGLWRSTTCSRRSTRGRYIHKMEFRSTGTVFLMFSVLSLEA